jgi:hypothetical protein
LQRRLDATANRVERMVDGRAAVDDRTEPARPDHGDNNSETVRFRGCGFTSLELDRPRPVMRRQRFADSSRDGAGVGVAVENYDCRQSPPP